MQSGEQLQDFLPFVVEMLFVELRTGKPFADFATEQTATARIFGSMTRVGLFIDDRPVSYGFFLDHDPESFSMVEVWGFGSKILAYTHEYMAWMTEHEWPAPPFEDDVNAQIAAAQAKKGEESLGDLLGAGDTWVVGEG